MPGFFDITTATSRVWLDADRNGKASFTVFNASASPLRGRVLLTAGNIADRGWGGGSGCPLDRAHSHSFIVRRSHGEPV